MDRRLMDALRVVGLELIQHPHDPKENEWFCNTPLGRIGPYRSEEWALVEGVRALCLHASGANDSLDELPLPFERFLNELEADRARRDRARIEFEE
jgi:hypothetical protein